MKTIIFLALLVLVSCSGNIENKTVTDCGKKQIGDNLYLKKLSIAGDRIYLLVDENDRLISGNTATSYTVSTGKNHRTTYSNSVE